MRAIQIVGPRKIAFVDVPMPTLQDGDVLVRCQWVGLCGSNMGQYTGEGVWANIKNPPGWAGHENIGVIVESRCPEWKEGQLVLAQPEGYLGFAEYFRARSPGIAELPKDAADAPSFMMAQPLATVLRAMTQTENVINQRCAVIGAGPMGLIWIHVLRLFGARQVIATDILDWRLAWAKRFGADAVIDASKENVTETVRELTAGQLLDFVATATTSAEALASSVSLLRRSGRLFVFGMPHHNDQKFPWYAAFRNELKIITSVGPECAAFFQLAMDMMVDGRASILGQAVTPRMRWEDAAKAFEMYRLCARDSQKLVLEL